ncbi:hypothetical protein F2P44_27535 [Massilia sp. CCM 8695]|uniref:Uncharacterized protein n=1 Tax=Massilia frigida TaxID=2609281 RepID=A0ABX0NHU0_9BURK|nr:hypothetical protein [Massilia frigida]NHZ83001.1 hypothetical protein [Massilia frigida]
MNFLHAVGLFREAMMIFLRTIGLLIALAVMVGCGACGVLGLILGTYTEEKTGSIELLVYGSIGLAIASLIAWGIFRRMRKLGAPRASKPPGQ